MTAKEPSPCLDQAIERLSLCDWTVDFPAATFDRGVDYALEGRVQDFQVNLSGNWFEVRGKVEGSRNEAYEVRIHFAAIGPLTLRGGCSCPVGEYCKHMVAILSDLEEYYEDDFPEEEVVVESPNLELPHQHALKRDAKSLFRSVQRTRPTKTEELSLDAGEWLSSLKSKLDPPQSDFELPEHFLDLAPGETGVFYHLAYPKDWNENRGGLLQFEICRVKRLKSGEFNQPVKIGTRNLAVGSFPYFIPWTERARINQMLKLSPGEDPGAGNFMFSPNTPTWSNLVEEMLADEVFVWDLSNPQPLKLAEDLEIEPFWSPLPDGSMVAGFRSAKEKRPVGLFDILKPIYVLPVDGTYGKANVTLPDGISLSSWMRAPVIRPSEFPKVNALLNFPTGKKAEGTKPLFPELPRIEKKLLDGKEIPPQGVLTLKRVNLTKNSDGKHHGYHRFFYLEEMDEYPIAALDFKYGEWTIENPMTGALECQVVKDGVIATIIRDLDAEENLTVQLFTSGLEPLRDQPFSSPLKSVSLENAFCYPAKEGEPNVAKWAEFCSRQIPALKEQGWEVKVDNSFYFKVAETNTWYADINEKDGEGIQWMSFDYGIEFEGRKISLLSVLATLLTKQGPDFDPRTLLEADEETTIPIFLEDGNLMVPIPARQLGHIYQSLTELLNYESGKLELHPLRAAQLVDDFGLNFFDDSGTVRRLAELSKKMADFDGIKKVKQPKALNAKLRPYQKEGLNWLQFLRESELNGILADDMGLGKTVQTLASIQVEKSSRRLKHPALIVAPTSVVTNWVSEAAKFTPALKVLLLHGLNRNEDFDAIQKHDLVVTSYALLNRDIEIHLANEYHYVILDEAQMIKNPKSQMARNACSLKSTHRLCLTGTPMENHLGELWSLIHFLMPGFLGAHKLFRKFWQIPIENRNDSFRRERLVKKISPILLRRTKDLVLDDLPPRTDMIQEVTLDKAQADLYEAVRAAMDKRVREALKDKGLNRSHIIVLDALLKLRQICCHPRLLKTESAKKVKHSAKLAVFEDLVSKQVEAGRRILVFSQFTSMITLLEESLDKLKIGHVKLTGSTTKRQEVIDQFQTGEVPVFLISLKAGGSGLNLTAADCVIHYDPWWNPAVEEQATARAHRIGQNNPVFVYRLVTKGSIEERILELQEKKAELARAVLSGGETGDEDSSVKAITQSDLEMLFAPMGE